MTFLKNIRGLCLYVLASKIIFLLGIIMNFHKEFLILMSSNIFWFIISLVYLKKFLKMFKEPKIKSKNSIFKRKIIYFALFIVYFSIFFFENLFYDKIDTILASFIIISILFSLQIIILVAMIIMIFNDISVIKSLINGILILVHA